VRSNISSLHSRPSNYLLQGARDDPLLLKEWVLVMRGDGKSPQTIEGYTDSVRQLSAFLKERGFLPPEQATAEHLREWLNQLRDKGNRPATVNTRYRGAHAFYRWLVREGEIKENPLDRIDPPRVPEAVQPYYTPAELQVILKALRGRRLRGVDAHRMQAIILLLFDCGLRSSELCALQIRDVSWDNQAIIVRQTKGGDQRVVSLGTTATRSALAYLRARNLESPWLFTTLDGTRLTRNALKLGLRRAFEAAQVQFRGVHAFRRASGIAYLQQGGQAEDLRVLMGWRSPEMVRRYVRAAEAERAVAAHKMFSPADHLEA